MDLSLGMTSVDGNGYTTARTIGIERWGAIWTARTLQ